MPTITFKTFSGSCSRYCNGILTFFSKYVWSKYVCQKTLKHEISINNLCPQSVLKHSVVHFQGIAMKI